MSYLDQCPVGEAKEILSFTACVKAYKAYIAERRKADIHAVLEECKQQRAINWSSSRGWSKKKEMRAQAKFPMWMVFHPEYGKYFSPDIPYEDRKKEVDKLLRRLDREVGNFRVNG